MRHHSLQSSIFILIVILAVAASLRIPGIGWGDGDLGKSSFARWNGDETTHVNIAKQFLSKKIDYGFYYVKAFGVHMAAVAVFNKLLDRKTTTHDLYRIGRWISLFYALATILLVYFGVLLVSQEDSLALWAAGFMALCSLAVNNSHFAVADSASVFWFWTTAVLAWWAIQKSSEAARMGAWATCGMAVGIKIAVAACAPLLVLFVISKKRWQELLSGVSVACLVFVFVNGWGVGLEGLYAIAKRISGDSVSVIPHHTMWETLFTLFISLFPAFSLPLLLLAGIGIFAISQKIAGTHLLSPPYKGGNTEEVSKMHFLWPYACFASPFILHCLLLLSLDDPFERHLLPLAPGICVLAAVGWQRISPIGEPPWKKLLWTLPLAAYLLFFAIDGEYPFWRDNRANARNWILNEVEPGSKILAGPYAWLDLPKNNYKITKSGLRSKTLSDPREFDLIILHEFHTYRYGRSRLSPFRKPSPDNIYHPDGFGRKYLDDLQKGKLPFQLIRKFPVPGQWALERIVYKKRWGTFSCFVGEIRIYSKVSSPGMAQ